MATTSAVVPRRAPRAWRPSSASTTTPSLPGKSRSLLQRAISRFGNGPRKRSSRVRGNSPSSTSGAVRTTRTSLPPSARCRATTRPSPPLWPFPTAVMRWAIASPAASISAAAVTPQRKASSSRATISLSERTSMLQIRISRNGKLRHSVKAAHFHDLERFSIIPCKFSCVPSHFSGKRYSCHAPSLYSPALL